MVVKTYVNDGKDRKDGLGATPTTIAPGEGWYIDFETDKTLRKAIRESATAGVQVKNASDQPIAVSIEGSDFAELLIAKKAGESVIIDRPSGIRVTNRGDNAIEANTLVITITTGANMVSGATGLGDIYITQDFGGEVYADSITATNDNAFVLGSVKLADAIIQVADNDALLGTATNQPIKVTNGSSLGITKVDLSTLYAKNATAGLNTTIKVFGVKI